MICIFSFSPHSEPHADAVALTVGGHHTCAVMTNGSVACWGYNDDGQLGTHDTTDRYTPTVVTWLGTGG